MPRRTASGIRRSWMLAAAIAAVVLLVIAAVLYVRIWSNVLWFRSIGYGSVYTTQLSTKTVEFFAGGILFTLLVSGNIYLAYRIRPAFRPAGLEHVLDRYRALIDPHRKAVLTVFSVFIGLLTGSSAEGMWKTWLLFAHRTSFGIKDPQFHVDVSFFTFVYPMLHSVLSFVFTAIVLAFFAALITHNLYGGIRPQAPRGQRVTPGARAHLSVLVGCFVLLKAVSYELDRYGLAYSNRGYVRGLSYTDVNAVLPAKTILAVIAVICAVLFFANVVRRGTTLPTVGLGLLILSAILVGGVYPALIQQFQVKPNEVDKEAPYIQRNINATRQAYGVNNVNVSSYGAKTKLTADKLASEAATIPSVRLLDPNVISSTFQQLQQVRSFYQFPDSLYIDRYPLGTGKKMLDTVVSEREISGPPQGQHNWINGHLVYTHGFGFVAAPGNQVDRDGKPDFVEKDIPPTGKLGKFQPRVYFGEDSRNYAIVGAPNGTRPREFDYPNGSSSGQANNTYRGADGVPIGSFGRRLLYALKFQEKNILLSGAINKDSKILYNREPRQRLAKVAPFLRVDGNPYPAIVHGRMVWVLDGYTTSSNYPYSQPTNFGAATKDTNTATVHRIARQPQEKINYIRNSVKATVDAYNGTVKLYQWDRKDPVLRTWMKAFPGLVRPKSQISTDMAQHLRYPEDLFKVQRYILEKYHERDARAFYSGQDFWQIPTDPTKKTRASEPPYRVTLRMPGATQPKFSLTSTFVPRGRENLSAYMVVDSVPGDPNYGKLRVLELPRNQAIAGPGQVQNNFESDPKVRSDLYKARQGAKTEMGNLLTLPFGRGLLYVEPVYLSSEARGQASYPTLKYVMVEFGDEVGIGSDLQDALNQIFKGGTSTGGGNAAGGPPAKPSAALTKDLSDAQTAYDDGVKALKRQDFKAYGDAQNRLKKALNRAAQDANKPAGNNKGG